MIITRILESNFMAKVYHRLSKMSVQNKNRKIKIITEKFIT